MSTMIQADKTPKPPDGREFSVTMLAVGYAVAVGAWAMGSRAVVSALGLDSTGSQFWLLVPPIGGAIIGVGFFFSVIRRYRKALQLWKDELSARERELEGIAATVANGIIIVDLEDQILRVNQAFCELFGYKEEEILGKPTDFLTVDGQPAESQPRAVLEAAKKVGLWQGHVLRCTQDGTALPVQLSIAPIRDEHGAVWRMSAITRTSGPRPKPASISRAWARWSRACRRKWTSKNWGERRSTPPCCSQAPRWAVWRSRPKMA